MVVDHELSNYFNISKTYIKTRYRPLNMSTLLSKTNNIFTYLVPLERVEYSTKNLSHEFLSIT